MKAGRRTLVLLHLVVLGGAAWGCSFERRPDLEEDGGAVATTGGVLAGPETDSAVAVVEAAEEALDTVGGPTAARGREALAPFLGPDATLYLSGPAGFAEDGADAGWQLVESRVELRDGVAVIFRRHRSTRPQEALAATRSGTWVLVRSETGWRILHVHRSRGRSGT